MRLTYNPIVRTPVALTDEIKDKVGRHFNNISTVLTEQHIDHNTLRDCIRAFDRDFAGNQFAAACHWLITKNNFALQRNLKPI